MRALVVYESMYGNTHVIAEAIARGLRPAYAVQVVSVAEARYEQVGRYDLVVVGEARRTRYEHARHPAERNRCVGTAGRAPAGRA